MDTVGEDVLDVYTFGAKLIETGDLDPVYIVLHEAHMEPEKLRRWLLAYWCFYHSGTASWITDSRYEEAYWSRMWQAAGSKTYPRSPERRHFRGKNALASVSYLCNRGLAAIFGPLLLSNYLYPLNYVMEYVQTWTGFGPWIAFKVADMLERLAICRIQFNDTAMFLFDSPKEGARMMWDAFHSAPPSSGEEAAWAVSQLIGNLGGGERMLQAPPRYERFVNAQEAETVLCKWKSYMKGHYHIGEDIESLRRGLIKGEFNKSPTAQSLYKAGRGKLW